MAIRTTQATIPMERVPPDNPLLRRMAGAAKRRGVSNLARCLILLLAGSHLELLGRVPRATFKKE